MCFIPGYSFHQFHFFSLFRKGKNSILQLFFPSYFPIAVIIFKSLFLTKISIIWAPANKRAYQIIYSTKYRQRTLIKEERVEVFKTMYGILKNNNSHVYRINGVEDHIHIVASLHPSVALADLIKVGLHSQLRNRYWN